MKRTLNLLIVVGIACSQFSSVVGGDKKKTDPIVIMPDAVKTGKGFSFQIGAIVPLFDTKKGTHLLELDMLWDCNGVGLIANHVDHGRGHTGKARIVDLGKIKLQDAKKAPADEGETTMAPTEGHTYCVRFANGKGFAFFHVINCDPVNGILVFAWKFSATK